VAGNGRTRISFLTAILTIRGQIFVFIGATLQASAYTVAHLVVGRVITGFGTGIDSSTVSLEERGSSGPLSTDFLHPASTGLTN
jgi:hypothetical protein